MTLLRRISVDQHASSAAEFALVLPLLMALIFISIDGGRYLYNTNRLEKAAQFGARFAVVTNPVASDLPAIDYVGQTVDGVKLTQGDRIPADALAKFNCISTGCDSPHTEDAAAFTAIVNRMKLLVPELQSSNVTITYSGSGLGYAGDPSGMQVAPLVTVQISGLTWQPVSGFTLLNAHYPTISTTLSAEDSVGAQSY